MTYTGTTYQFNVNGIYAPNYQPTFEQAFPNVMTSYGLANDLSGGGNPMLNSLGALVGGIGHTECRWDAGDGVTVISGLNTGMG